MNKPLVSKTDEVLDVLDDDLAVQIWQQQVRDEDGNETLTERTRRWIEQVDWMDDRELDSVDWKRVVHFLNTRSTEEQGS